MALISPGIQVTVTDESNYLPTAVGSVPFVLVATAENKNVPGSTAIAAGTLKENAGLVNVVTSQRELASLFGYPIFRTSTSGSPLHGDELNEYGLMAAYSALGVANRAFIIRADVDLNQLVSTSVRPTGDPEAGAHWLDLSDTTWGLNVWDATQAPGVPVSTPVTVLNNLNQVSGAIPLPSVGTTGDYAVVTTSTFNQMYYKAGPFVGANIAPHSWVVVGSDDWQNAVPTYFSDASVGSTIVGGANLVINSVNVSLSSGATITAVASAINSAGIPGVAARFNTLTSVLNLFATANSKSDGSTIDGKLKIHSVSDSPAGNAWVLANLNLTSGTYACPAVSFTTQAPQWKSFDATPRPSDSVWINTSKSLALNSANLNVKTYNINTGEWAQIGAPLYADDHIALYNLDPIAGGIDIPRGTVYIKYNSVENGTLTVSGSDVIVTDGTVSYTPYIKTTNGVLQVTGGLPTTPLEFDVGESFTVQASVPGSLSMSSIVTVTLTGTTAQSFVADFAANVGPVINDVVATVEDTGAISIRHLSGGMIRLKNNSGNPLGDAGFSSDVANMRLDVNENVLIASPFELLEYTASDTRPFSNPESGTVWYYGSPTEVDIMVHDGSGWKGYATVGLDARGFDLTDTDPKGVLFGTVEPIAQSDGSALVSGDLWIDTSDLENYPKLYRYNATTDKWTQIDNTDRITEDGIIFADARWDTNGNTNPINDQLTNITELLNSNWLDSDAPDYRLYARGTLLFNTRRSGYNVKKFVNNYWNLTAFPDDQDPGHEHTELDAWVSTSGSKENGEPLMGRRAVRDVVVRALQSAVDSSTAIREEQLDFNLMAAPGYTELVDNLSALNADRKGTAHIIGDTPMRLPANGTALTVWATGGTDKRLKFSGEDGFATVDNTISLYYPSGITNDLQGRTIAVPPSHMMLRTMIRNDQAAFAWFAPAGVRRGTIDNVSGIGYVNSDTGGFVRVGINEGLRDILYTNNINPITILPGVGLLNFGNKTRAGVNSALDRVNVSRLVSYIRRQLAQVANNYLFEPNDAITRNSIKLLIGGLLNDLIAKRGITDYLVVCDETNNTPDRVARNELYVDVAIEPTKTVEFIYIPIRIKNPGEIRSGNDASSNPV